jgi:presenilin 1
MRTIHEASEEEEDRGTLLAAASPSSEALEAGVHAPSTPPLAPDNGEDTKDVQYAYKIFVAMALPVTLTVLLSGLACVLVDSPFTALSLSGALAYSITDDAESGSAAVKMGKGVANALAFVGAVVAMTLLIVFLFWAGCTGCIRCYLVFAQLVLFSFLGGTFALSACYQYEVPVYWPVFFVALGSFTVAGVVAVFVPHGVPRPVKQAFLICMCVLLSWEFSGIDEYTCFAVLGALAAYDLYAVLHPWGPLRVLVDLMEARNETLPGLLFEARVGGLGGDSSAHSADFTDTADRSLNTVEHRNRHRPRQPRQPRQHRPHRPHRQQQQRQQERQQPAVSELPHVDVEAVPADAKLFVLLPTAATEASAPPSTAPLLTPPEPPATDALDVDFRPRTAKVGLGDFIFYSMLCSRAARYGVLPFVVTTAAVLVGLAATLLLLVVHKRAVPALPLSIFLGILAFAATRAVLNAAHVPSPWFTHP